MVALTQGRGIRTIPDERILDVKGREAKRVKEKLAL